MCIIIAKNKGQDIPSREILEQCFISNKDGAGFAYSDGKSVIIKKGYFNIDNLLEDLSKVKDARSRGMIIHFRITTHGGTSAGNCHPFSVTSDEKKLTSLYTKTKLAIAHNGMIDIKTPKHLSDTMIFIRDELSLLNKSMPSWYKDINILSMIESRISSKLAILNARGEITTIGKFNEDDDGVLYSNYSWLERDYDYYYDYYGYNHYGETLADKVKLYIPKQAYLMSEDDGTYYEAGFDYGVDELGDVYEIYDGYAWLIRGFILTDYQGDEIDYIAGEAIEYKIDYIAGGGEDYC